MFSCACGANSVGDAGSAGEAGSASLVPLVIRVLLVLLVMLILLASAGDTGFFWLMLIVSRMLAGRFWCCRCCLWSQASVASGLFYSRLFAFIK